MLLSWENLSFNSSHLMLSEQQQQKPLCLRLSESSNLKEVSLSKVVASNYSRDFPLCSVLDNQFAIISFTFQLTSAERFQLPGLFSFSHWTHLGTSQPAFVPCITEQIHEAAMQSFCLFGIHNRVPSQQQWEKNRQWFESCSLVCINW